MLKKIAPFFCLICSFSALASDVLSFSHVTVRAPIPGVPNTAAFMTIENTSNQAIQLIEANSTIAKRVELHNHFHQDGMMKMRQVSAITIPARGQQQLKSGSYHIMLFDLVNPIKDGDKVNLQLSFSNGQHLTVTAQVKDMMTHHHHH